jgi:hypothetical protein
MDKYRGENTSSVRERTAAHELAHHLYAQELELESDGIKLGPEPDTPRVIGRTLITEALKEKERAGTLVDADVYNAAHAYLANGFGEEAALGTPTHEWSDEGDIVLVKHLLRNRFAASDSQIETFISDSRAKAQKFFARPEVKSQIQRAYKPLAAKHWGRTVNPEQIRKYTEGK